MTVLEQPVPFGSTTDTSEDMSGLVKAFFIGFIIAALLTGAISGFVIWRMSVLLNTANTELAAAQAQLTSAQAEVGATQTVQYYRGLYDFCIFIAGNVYSTPAADASGQCTSFAAKAQGANWYGQESTGWAWPLAEEAK